MAKMKVHELAKELDRKSKELIDFLQAKGYEVKAAQSSIEDEAIALVKKEFGKAEQEKPAKEEKLQEAKTEAAPEAAKVTPEAPKAPEEKKDGKAEAPKKKKIIFVSNPQNSKMGGRPAQGGGNRGNGRPMGNGARPVQPQNAPHKIVRPTQKPIPVTAEPYDVRQKQQQERRLEQRQQEKRENSRNVTTAGQERAGSAGENQRAEGQGKNKPEKRKT